MRYRKRADVTIEALELKHRITLTDHEGNVRTFLPGDYLVTGVLERQYGIERAVFERTYEPVPEPEP